jgi:hypothetical protein
MGFAAMAALAPACRARNLRSSPNRKLKFSMEKIPEKTQITNPVAKPEPEEVLAESRSLI